MTVLEAAIDLASFSGILLTIYPPLVAVLVAYAAGGTVASLALGKVGRRAGAGRWVGRWRERSRPAAALPGMLQGPHHSVPLVEARLARRPKPLATHRKEPLIHYRLMAF